MNGKQLMISKNLHNTIIQTNKAHSKGGPSKVSVTPTLTYI